MMRTRKTAALLLGLAGAALSLPGQSIRHHPLGDGEIRRRAAFCEERRAEDVLVEFGSRSAVLGGASRTVLSFINYPVADALGCLIGLSPGDAPVRSRICIGAPFLKIRDKQETVPYLSIEPVENEGGNGVLVMLAEGDFQGPRGESARIVTRYRFDAATGGIDLESELTNTGKDPIERCSYSLYGDTGTRFSFSPLHAEYFPDCRFRISVKPGHSLAWIDRRPAGDAPPGSLAPGETRRAAFTLLTDADLHGLLKQAYDRLGREIQSLELSLTDAPSEPVEVIIRDAVGGSIFYHNLFTGGRISGIPLPAGVYTAEVHAFPAVASATFAVGPGSDNHVELENPPRGTVRVRIRDGSGRAVPGRVTFLGLDGTPLPHFRPENPIESGRKWETRKNSLFPGLGEAEAELATGAYLAIASRGPEYGLDRRVVEVLKDDRRFLNFIIDREVDSTGWLSVDPHLHTTLSDGNMGIPARVLSAAAEGLDVAVSSDHNVISDYFPDIRRLGLDHILAFILGNEVTINGMIHYNTFPLTWRPDVPGNGAIDPLSNNVSELFRRSRDADPGALIQVNHPRSGTLGYFNMFELDEESADFALQGLDLEFDTLEVYNGPYRHDGNAASIRDWFHLINRGRYFPLTGSSDSHRIDGGEPGYARTYVRYTGGTGRDLDEAAVILALKAGHSFATNGPLVDVLVNDRAGMGQIDTDRDGTVEILIRIQSAPWVAADEARIFVNGRLKAGFPVFPNPNGAVDFLQTTSLPITEDSALVVEVLGRRTLYPVMQHRAPGGEPGQGVLPFAITNPVFIDTDGNGRFDPPRPGEIRLLERIPEKKTEEEIHDRCSNQNPLPVS